MHILVVLRSLATAAGVILQHLFLRPLVILRLSESQVGATIHRSVVGVEVLLLLVCLIPVELLLLLRVNIIVRLVELFLYDIDLAPFHKALVEIGGSTRLCPSVCLLLRDGVMCVLLFVDFFGVEGIFLLYLLLMLIF